MNTMRVLHGLCDLCVLILQGKILDDLLLNTVKREKEEGWRCKRGHASNPRQHGRQLSRNFEAKVKPCSDANAGGGTGAGLLSTTWCQNGAADVCEGRLLIRNAIIRRILAVCKHMSRTCPAQHLTYKDIYFPDILIIQKLLKLCFSVLRHSL